MNLDDFVQDEPAITQDGESIVPNRASLNDGIGNLRSVGKKVLLKWQRSNVKKMNLERWNPSLFVVLSWSVDQLPEV